VINGITTSDLSGSSVSTAGDVNGDGYDDLLVGAYFADPHGGNSGESYIIYGTDLGAPTDVPGTTGDDTLTATTANDIVIGGLGDDSLNQASNAGVVLKGGAGDDTLRIGDTNADTDIDNDDFLSIEGDNGQDTVALIGSGLSLDVTDDTLRISNVEIFDLGSTSNSFSIDKLIAAIQGAEL